MSEKKIVLVLSDGEPKSLALIANFESEIANKKYNSTEAILIQNNFDHVCSQFKHEKFALNLAKETFEIFSSKSFLMHRYNKCDEVTFYLFFYSQIVFNFFRVMVKEGKLNKDQIEILWFYMSPSDGPTSRTLKIDANGCLPVWPDELFSTNDKLLCRLIQK